MPTRPARLRASYLEGDTITEGQVRELFDAAAALHRLAPWTIAAEDQVLAVDIPALRIHDACLTVMGARGDDRGFLLFDSYAAWESFGTTDLSGFLLSLNFEPGDALPPSMRAEVATHDWPIVAPDAHPVVLCLHPDGTRRPTTPADVAVAAVCAGVLVPFFERHAGTFRARRATFLAEELAVGDDVLVRVRWPHPDVASRLRITPGAVCPCGSGRTFGGCHLRDDPSAPIRAFKRAYYVTWPEQALPALGGRSARRMAATEEGRVAVARVVAGIAALEQEAPAAERFDVASLRAALGLDV